MEIVPIGGALGAEIRGVDPRTVDDAGLADCVEALHRFGVVFFPGVGLGPEEQMTFAARLGRLEVFPAARAMGAVDPTFQVIEDGPDMPVAADMWHTDASWIADPPKYAVLHAEVMPERGGDTLWSSTAAAFDQLSPRVQEFLCGLEARHDSTPFIEGFIEKMSTRIDAGKLEEFAETLRGMFPAVTHPVVITIPETGRRALYLGGPVMDRILGLNDGESEALLAFLNGLVADPAVQIRWRWSAGDLAVWDERSTNHRNSGDYWPQRRIIRRVEVRGEPLVAA